MLVDANVLPEATVIQADACVIGAGPAGLTLAQQLAREGIRVCLLESGGLETETQPESLSGGVVSGDWVEPLAETRVRRIGGTAHIWSVRLGFGRTGAHYVPLGPIDFEPRSFNRYSGWPFACDELVPYYRQAQAVCGLGPFAYDAAAWSTPSTPPLPLCAGLLRTAVLQHGARSSFTRRLRDMISASRNAALYMHATALRLCVSDGCSAVSTVEAISGRGRRISVSARTYVLAMGGIENARLLLLSNDRQAGGIGNEHDLVGRFLIEHPHLAVGVLRPFDPTIFRRAGLYDTRTVRGVPIKGHLAPTEATLRREAIPNLGIFIYPRPRPHHADAAAAAWSLALRPSIVLSSEGRHLLQRALRGPTYLLPALLRTLSHPQPLLPDHSWGGWSQGLAAAKGFAAFEVAASVEQMPSPTNRVTLDDGVDGLGQRRARVEWRWSADDAAALWRALKLVEAEFRRSGLGVYQAAVPDEPPSLSHHHMGTTRMHDDPRQGVVDRDCRVHGIENLYIAGSSVFPTGGYANPTLTIVALALRLAARLQGVLRAEGTAAMIELQPAVTPPAERLPA